MNKYRCSQCGYCYIPEEEVTAVLAESAVPVNGESLPKKSTPFKKLDSAWCCPQCGGTKNKFRPYGQKRRY